MQFIFWIDSKMWWTSLKLARRTILYKKKKLNYLSQKVGQFGNSKRSVLRDALSRKEGREKTLIRSKFRYSNFKSNWLKIANCFYDLWHHFVHRVTGYLVCRYKFIPWKQNTYVNLNEWIICTFHVMKNICVNPLRKKQVLTFHACESLWPVYFN